MLDDGGFLVLDTELTQELIAEGIARDVIRTIQSARKDADLNVSDRITTTLTAAPKVVAAVEAHQDLVKAETLTRNLHLLEGDQTEQMRATVAAVEQPDGSGAAE